MTWSVQLSGTRRNLDRFSKAMPPELGDLSADSRGYFLHLPCFDQLLKSAEIHQVAEKFLKEFHPKEAVNGIDASHVWRTNKDGTKTVFMTTHFQVTSTVKSDIQNAPN